MTAWTMGISATLLTGLILFIVKWGWNRLMLHKEDHKFVNDLKDAVNCHRKDHLEIKKSLQLLQEANVSQMRNQILSIYEEVMAAGEITVHRRSVFHDLCEKYFSNGGNGFVESLIPDVDALPIKS